MFVTHRVLPPARLARPGNSGWGRYCSPRGFYPLIGVLIPWLSAGALMLTALGVYIGLCMASGDARHGGIYRIAFVHVPATWMSVFILVLMAFWSGVGLLFQTRLPAMMAQALAPTGAMFAFMALWTGSLWGKPVWGAWWIWDVRLIAEIVLLLVYLAIIAIHMSAEDARRADRIAGIVALLGAAVVAVNLVSVAFWPRIHQYPSLSMNGSSGTALTVVTGVLAMAAGFWMYSTAAVLARLRCVILERERHSDWVTRCTREDYA